MIFDGFRVSWQQDALYYSQRSIFRLYRNDYSTTQKVKILTPDNDSPDVVAYERGDKVIYSHGEEPRDAEITNIDKSGETPEYTVRFADGGERAVLAKSLQRKSG